MKYISILVIAIFLLTCKSSTVVMNNEDPSQNIIPKPSKNDVIMASSSESKLLDSVTAKELNELVSNLASDEFQGRKTGTEGIEKAAVFIENKFKSFKVKPYFEGYRDNYKIGDTDAFNVVGFIEGNDPTLKNEIIILGAHYDHIGVGQSMKKFGGRLTETDSIANGANDDASGTATVMAIAKYFSEKKSNKRSIIFALYSGEELGVLGSKHLAKRLKTENIDLYTMISFEMVGVPLKDRDYVAFLSGFDLSNMASKLNEYAKFNLLGLSEVAKQYKLFQRSDNYPFYEEFKLPCQTISSCDLTNYDFYHHVDDEADQLDYDFMAGLINNLIPAIEKMSNTVSKEIKMYE
jgi:hypothetical protein